MMEPTHESSQHNSGDNARMIEAAITQLHELSSAAAVSGYKDFWSCSKRVLDLFKTLKPLDPGDRQRLWERYREICDIIHIKQVEEKQSLRESSQSKREAIEADIAQASALLVEGAEIESLAKARDLLQAAMAKMKTANESSPISVEEGAGTTAVTRLLKEDREICWQKWQQVREHLGNLQKEYHEKILVQAQELAESAQTADPPAVLKAIRELQQLSILLGLSREQRETTREILNNAWKTAITRLQQFREERKVKHQEWVQRMETNLQRWAEQIQRREQTMVHLKGQIDKLQGMLESARSDDHAERVRGWIAETEEKIRKTDEVLVSLKEKSAAVEGKLKKR